MRLTSDTEIAKLYQRRTTMHILDKNDGSYIVFACNPMEDIIDTDFRETLANKIITDIVTGTQKELEQFIELWMPEYEDRFYNYSGSRYHVHQPIPLDVFIQNTIPIQHIAIEYEINGQPVYSAVYIDDNINIDKLSGSESIPVGYIHINTGVMNVGFILITTKFGVIVSPDASYISDKLSITATRLIFSLMNSESIRETYSYASKILKIWYGIQISLLHPLTCVIYQNPKEVSLESCDEEDEKLSTYIPAKEKKARYVKRHIIKENHGVLDILTVEATKKLKMRQTKRHTLLWRVIGHYRNQNGKRIWIKPYWKGPLRNFTHKYDDVIVNHRVVDITDDARECSNISKET